MFLFTSVEKAYHKLLRQILGETFQPSPPIELVLRIINMRMIRACLLSCNENDRIVGQLSQNPAHYVEKGRHRDSRSVHLIFNAIVSSSYLAANSWFTDLQKLIVPFC